MDENLNLQCQQVIAICESIDETVYITDPDTSEILFINQTLRKEFGDVVGKKCYEVLQGLNSPCGFCTNKYIFGENVGKTYIWEFQNRVNGRWYHCIDKAIPWPDGRLVRCEIAIDITGRKQTEETLRESEERFRKILEEGPLGMALVGRDFRFIEANPPFCRMTGYSQEELSKLTFLDITHPEDVNNDAKLSEQLFKGEIPHFKLEKRYITKNKKVIWVGLTASIIRDKYEKPIYGLAMVEDITEKKKTEEDFSLQRERLQLQIDRMPIGCIVWDSNFRVMSWNPAAESIFGFTFQEATGKHPYGFIVPKQAQQQVDEIWGRLLEGDLTANSINENLTKDGRTILCDWTNTPLRKDDGSIIGVLSMVQDITERKRSNEELQRQREELQTIFDSVPAMVFYKDRENRMLKVNSAFAKVMGVSKEEIEGKTCFELWSAEQAKKYFCDDEEVISSGLPKLDIIERLETAKGVRWVCTQKIPYRDKDGNVIGVLGFATDISERKQAEEEKEKLNKEILKSNKKLKQLALRDPHTGLFNHRYFQEVIEREFDRAKRNGNNLSLIMLDLDYFKSINDVYGHIFGDLVLKQLATQIKRMVRGYDIVIRYGGEEFVIICPVTTRSSALVLAQRIMEAINLYTFGNNKNMVKIKLSLAVASYPENHILNGMDLVRLTDQILSKAKESGGNRVYSSLDVEKGKKRASETNIKNAEEVKLLKEKLEKLTKRANQNLIEATFAFAKTIDLKDHYTGEHVEKTVHYATEIASLLGLSKNEIELVKQASILHDLGKIGISEKILLKKSKLTRGELQEVKKHPRIGVEIIRPIHFLHSIVPLILYHHERWDGKGYPYGLKGEEIPVGARIIALADVYQALISDRPYHKAYSEDEAIGIIKNGSGTQFDPHIVITFLRILKQKK